MHVTNEQNLSHFHFAIECFKRSVCSAFSRYFSLYTIWNYSIRMRFSSWKCHRVVISLFLSHTLYVQVCLVSCWFSAARAYTFMLMYLFAFSRSLTSNFDNQNAKCYFVVFAPYMQVYHVWINHQSAKSQSLFSWLANQKSSFSRKSKTLTGRTLYPRSFAYVRFTGSLHVYSVVQWSQNWSNGLDTTTLRVYSIVQFAQYLSSGLYTTNRFFRIRTSARFEISMHFVYTFHTLFTHFLHFGQRVLFVVVVPLFISILPIGFASHFFRFSFFSFDYNSFFFSFYFILFTHTFSIWFRT